jgi:hypothetical protein
MSSVSSVNSSSMISQIHHSYGKVDPYDIVAAGIEAIGGQQVLDDTENTMQVGTISVGSSSYGYQEWHKYPSQMRIEMWDGDSLLFANGDDSSNIWEYRDEKIDSYSDPESEDRKIRDGLNSYEYADRENRTFQVSLDSVTYIDGQKNYRVKVANRLNDTVVYRDYNADTFMLTQETKDENDQTIVTEYDDWDTVGGLKVPMSRVMTNKDTDVVQTILITDYKRNTKLAKDLFDSPDKSSYSFTNMATGTTALISNSASGMTLVTS